MSTKLKWVWVSFLFLWSLQLMGQGLVSPRGALLEIKGPIGPATSDYFSRSLEKAIDQEASLVVIQMDTPGGLDTAMRDIIQKIMTSPIPVVCFVAPSGSRAASAGTYILYASHIAAMAPATNLGAATPVQMGGLPIPNIPGKDKSEEEEKPDPVAGKTAMERKIINDAEAYLIGLAQLRHRNIDWAKKAVKEGASLPAEEALKLGVIDFMANDVASLLKQLDGRKVNVLGEERTLQTQGLAMQRLEPDWRSKLLSVLTNPNVAYILMLIGIYGLILEFYSPGAILPGVVGAISLLLALYALQTLPVNYAGLGLVLLGIVLMVAEAFTPSIGVLGIGGVIAFVIGSIILMDPELPGYGISPALIGTFAIGSAAFCILILGAAIKARQRPVVSIQDNIIGSTAVSLSDFDQEGPIRLGGEIWQAQTRHPIKQGQVVRVIEMDGLTVMVEPQRETQEGGSNV